MNDDKSDDCWVAEDEESDGQNESENEEVDVVESIWKCSGRVVPGAAN